jgi:putative tricarboxylic transport membrane protein
MLIFAIAGYFMKKGDVPAAPMLMALLMGPMLERASYQALNLAHGNPLVFIQRPISATLLSMIVLLALYKLIMKLRGKKAAIEETEE